MNKKKTYVDEYGRFLSKEEISSSSWGNETTEGSEARKGLLGGYHRGAEKATETQQSVAQGTLVKRWRTKLKWSLEEVARKLEVRVEDLKDFEHGHLKNLPGWEFEDIEYFFKRQLNHKFDW